MLFEFNTEGRNQCVYAWAPVTRLGSNFIASKFGLDFMKKGLDGGQIVKHKKKINR
jgi:hypothetical protein